MESDYKLLSLHETIVKEEMMFFLAVGVRVNGPKRNKKNQLERKMEGLSTAILVSLSLSMFCRILQFCFHNLLHSIYRPKTASKFVQLQCSI